MNKTTKWIITVYRESSDPWIYIQIAQCFGTKKHAQPRTSATACVAAGSTIKVGLCGSYRFKGEKGHPNQYGSSDLLASLDYEMFVPLLKQNNQHLLSSKKNHSKCIN